MFANAGAFDAWGSSLVEGLIGAVGGAAAALVAVWLTRRNDIEQAKRQDALRGAEEIVLMLVDFLQAWRQVSAEHFDEWQDKMRDHYFRTRFGAVAKSPTVYDTKLHDHLSSIFDALKDILDAQVQVRTRVGPPPRQEKALKELDDLLGEGLQEGINSMNYWRENLKVEAVAPAATAGKFRAWNVGYPQVQIST